MHFSFKVLLGSILLSSVALTAQAKDTAQENSKDVIDISSEAKSIKEDIAYTQVFSEICPQLIGQNKNFDRAYQNVLKAKLVGVPNPDVAVKYLNEEDAEFKELLKLFRTDIAKASREDNRTVCLDMIEWDKKK